jgi:hypothetical protein
MQRETMIEELIDPRQTETDRERERQREKERQREIGVKVRDCYWMSVRHARSIDGDYFLYIQQVYDWSGSGWILSSKRSVEGHIGEYLGSAHLSFFFFPCVLGSALTPQSNRSRQSQTDWLVLEKLHARHSGAISALFRPISSSSL